MSPYITGPMLFCFSVFILCHGIVITEPLLSNGLFRLVKETCVSEPLASNGLFRLSGVMSRYISPTLPLIKFMQFYIKPPLSILYILHISYFILENNFNTYIYTHSLKIVTFA
jgi:hypothetical protein